MEPNVKPKRRRLSVGLFTAGVLIGFVFNILMVWANLEASFWNRLPVQNASLDGLNCPLVITRPQTANITILYKNTLDRDINPVIRTKISERLTSLEREEETRPDIAPGDTARVVYSIEGANAVWNRFIMVRVNTLPQFSLPARTGSCGILVVNIPFLNGGVVIAMSLLLSLAGMGSGLWLWRRQFTLMQGRVKTTFQAMVYLAGAVVVGMALEFLSVWSLATILVVATFVLIVAVLGYFFASA